MNFEFDKRASVRGFHAKIRSGELRLEKRRCLCGRDDSKLLARYSAYGERNRVVICRHCGLIYADPYFDAVSLSWFYSSDIYRKIYDGSDFLEIARQRVTSGSGTVLPVLPMIRRWKAPGASVVEIGCGAGWNLVPFLKAGYATCGYEYSAGLVEVGRAHGLDVRVGAAAAGTYDVVIVNQVLEHNPDFSVFVQSLGKLLASGGILYIGVPNMDMYRAGQFQSAHCHYFTPPTLRHYMALEGFECLALEPSSEFNMHGVFVLGREVEPPSLSGEFARMSDVIAGHHLGVFAKNTLHHLVTYLP